MAGADPITRAKNRGSPHSSAKDVLAEGEREAAELWRGKVQKALDLDTAEVLQRPGVRKHGKRACEIRYKGYTVELMVQRLNTPDGYRYPPLYYQLEANTEVVVNAIVAGVPGRQIPALLAANAGGKQPKGSSRSNVDRINKGIGQQHSDELDNRWLGDMGIVAVEIDGTAIGNRNEKKTVIAAMGYTADGRKIALGRVIGHENEANVLRLLNPLVNKRGMDPRVLWICDHSGGIRNAIRTVCAPWGDPSIQGCTTHGVRGLVNTHLNGKSEELQEWVRWRMYGALARRDPEVALVKLEALAVELEQLQLPSMATSLRGEMDYLVTSIRMGLSGELNRQLRTTNAIESANRLIKDESEHVTRWDDEKRLRWSAVAMMRAEKERWTRLANPEALIAMSERMAPGRIDAKAIRARLPPTIQVTELQGPADDDAGVRRFATEWLRGPGRGIWLGSDGALAKLGLRPRSEVTAEQLARAVQGRHVDGTWARQPGRLVVTRPDDENRRVFKETVKGAKSAGFTLDPPPLVAERWRNGNEAERAAIERSLMRAAGAGVASLTRTTEDGHGVAAAVMMSLEGDDPSSARPCVRGVIVGVRRGAGKLQSPAVRETFDARTARQAEDAAKALLDAELGLAPVEPARSEAVQVRPATQARRATQAVGARPAEPAFDNLLRRSREILGQRRAKEIETRAAQLVEPVARQSEEWVVGKLDEQRKRGYPLDSLADPDARAGAQATLDLEQRKARLERERWAARNRGAVSAADPRVKHLVQRLNDLAAEERALRKSGHHLNDWMAANGERAAQLLALMKVAVDRGLHLRAVESPQPAQEIASPRTEPEAAPAQERAATEDGGYGL